MQCSIYRWLPLTDRDDVLPAFFVWVFLAEILSGSAQEMRSQK